MRLDVAGGSGYGLPRALRRARMLGLLAPTDPHWVREAERNLDGLLADHAHCELKAAQSALSLAGRFGSEFPKLVPPLLALAREEIAHFGEVADRVETRGATIGTPAADDYVVQLRAVAKTIPAGTSHPLLDRLLVSALIEARSCERFRLLSQHLADSDLRTFYAGLMAAEARHYRLFAELAEEQFGVESVRARLAAFAAEEAAIARTLPLGPTVHG